MASTGMRTKEIFDNMKEAMKNNPFVAFGENDYNPGIYLPILRKKGGHIHALAIENERCAFLQNLPEGAKRMNEYGTVWWYDGISVDYHDHLWGYETFLCTSGEVEAWLNHQHTMIGEGDIFFTRPHVQHGFINHETVPGQGVTWLEMFDDIQLYYGVDMEMRLGRLYPEWRDNEAFMGRYFEELGDLYRSEFPRVELVDKSEVSWVRPKDRFIRTFNTAAGDFHLRIGRWDFDGVKEVWELHPKKGLRIEFAEPFGDYPLLYVLSGGMVVECEGMAYEAGPEDSIHIPPWRPFSISFPEAGARVLDYNEQSQLLFLLEHLQSVKDASPAGLSDWEGAVVPILRKYNCWATSVSGI